MLFLTSYRRVIARLPRNVFSNYRSYYLGMNRNAKISEESAIELLDEQLKNPNSNLRSTRVLGLLSCIHFNKLPPSILTKAILSQREIFGKKLITKQDTEAEEYEEERDSPYLLFDVEDRLLSIPSLDQINFQNGKGITTDVLINTIDPEKGYTALTATLVFLQDLDKAPSTIKDKEIYIRQTVRFFRSLIENGADPAKKDSHGNMVFTLLDTLPKTVQKEIKEILLKNESKYEHAKSFIEKIKEDINKEEKGKELYYKAMNIAFGLFGAAIGHFSSKFIISPLIEESLIIPKTEHQVDEDDDTPHLKP